MVYPEETEDDPEIQVHTKESVGRSLKELDDGLIVLVHETRSLCFGWIPTDPVVEPSATIKALAWDPVE